MRSPSIKRLVSEFGITRAQASLVKRLCAARPSSERLQALIEAECPATDAYARSCYGDPYRGTLWRTTLVLHAIDCIVGTHGVEALGPVRDGDYVPAYEYLNAGDPYVATLVYKRDSDNLYIVCWGDIAERLPRENDAA